jgi:hypothetical protein
MNSSHFIFFSSISAALLLLKKSISISVSTFSTPRHTKKFLKPPSQLRRDRTESLALKNLNKLAAAADDPTPSATLPHPPGSHFLGLWILFWRGTFTSVLCDIRVPNSQGKYFDMIKNN